MAGLDLPEVMPVTDWVEGVGKTAGTDTSGHGAVANPGAAADPGPSGSHAGQDAGQRAGQPIEVERRGEHVAVVDLPA